MTTLERLAHLYEEDGACLVWKGGCCNGHPAMRKDGKTVLVRRVLWQEQNGDIPPGHIVRMTCECKKCIEPAHMVCTTHQKLAKQMGALGVMSGPVRSAAIARAKRKTHAILTDEAVADIRTEKEFGYVYAERYGVSAGHVSKVQKHKARRDFGSPFAGLGAR